MYHRPEFPSADVGADKWDVDHVVQHCWRDGRLELLVRWENCRPKEDTWEPVHSFVLPSSVPWVESCKHMGLQVDLLPHMGGKSVAQ